MEVRRQILGVTGGVGCGKSEVARMLRARGVAVLDTDDVAHEVIRAPSPVYRSLVARFGEGVLQADGEIDRARVAAVVFADASQREALNRLVHPAVQDETVRWLEALPKGAPGAVVVPLLYEIGWTEPWTQVACVAAPEQVVRARLRARGWSEEETNRRLEAQWPLADKVSRADYVISNGGDLADLAREVERVWRLFSERSA